MLNLRTCTPPIVALLILYQAAAAQDSTQSTPPDTPATAIAEPMEQTQTHLRFRPVWGKECKSFLVIETGFIGTLGNSEYRDVIADGVYMFDLGAMVNLSDRLALGATAEVSAAFFDSREEVVARFALKPRLRYWIDRRIGVHIAPGIMFVPGDGSRNHPGRMQLIDSPVFVTEFGMSFADLFLLVAQVEFINGHQEDWIYPAGYTYEDVNTTTWSAGVKFGTYPGFVLGALFVALGSLVALTSGG